jgi:hypothetical protein
VLVVVLVAVLVVELVVLDVCESIKLTWNKTTIKWLIKFYSI